MNDIYISRGLGFLSLCMKIMFFFNYQSAFPIADLQSRSVMLSVWLQKSKACAVQFHSHRTSSCRISSPAAHPSEGCSLPRRYSVLGRAKFHPSDLKKLKRNNIAERRWGFKTNLAHVYHNNRVKFPKDLFLFVLCTNMAPMTSGENHIRVGKYQT